MGEVLYLTTLECLNGHERTFAHEGPFEPNLMKDTPLPDVLVCPRCGGDYLDDLGAAVTEEHVAERVSPSGRARFTGERGGAGIGVRTEWIDEPDGRLTGIEVGLQMAGWNTVEREER